MVEAAGIEPYAGLFENRRRRATFVVNSKQGKGFGFQLVVPVSPQESPTVLLSLGEIVESGGNGVPTPVASGG